jgi:orotidine-5'-phosphate decarboxylase
MSTQSQQFASRVMVALDYPSVAAAERLLEQLTGTGCYLKVGMQLYYAAGPAFIRELKERDYLVFLDLKLHDIPNTVRGAAASITELGVDMFNVHAAGGIKMMEHALLGVHDVLATGEPSSRKKPRIIAVTQLTSTSSQVMNEEIGISGSIEDCVLQYASHAARAGLDGVVASPQEVKRIKSLLGETFITVTPGIRPAGSALGDQTRVMTPQQAFVEGTDFIVVGRPITAAANPREAFDQLLASVTDRK